MSKNKKNAFMNDTSLNEQIAKALVNNAVNDGFLVSVNKAQNSKISLSRNVAAITGAMFRTNMDKLTLNVEERRAGVITLTYGSGRDGADVISDHSDVPHINRLVQNTKKQFGF